MASIELMKRWRATKELLHRAQAAIPASEEPQHEVTERQIQFTEGIEHNELELALDALEELGELAACRGGFWRDLERAAAMMELHERAPQFRSRFISTRPPSAQ